jgi:hypothetical protein
MKAFQIFGIILLMTSINISCTGQQPKSQPETAVESSIEVNVYYFHNERRCATCKAVESESRQAIKELYGNRVSFASYNLDREEGEQKGKEIDVDVQSLVIVGGTQKIDVTNEAFLFARNNPEKLKSILKEKIDALIL